MSQVHVPGFHDPIHIRSSDTNLPVYVSVEGIKPLVVLHELPGMSQSFVEFCQQMAEQGFKVYMPLLFKSPYTEMSSFDSVLFCISREFRNLFYVQGPKRRSKPFTAWLIELINQVARDNPDAKIGVVGMCLTGGFSIAAIGVPNVSAAVVCQPSMPFFFNINTLGLTDEQRRIIKARAQHLPAPCAKGYRFQEDRISRDSHMRAVHNLIGDTFMRYPDLPGKGHSTLTTNTRSEAVFADVLQFLNSRL